MKTIRDSPSAIRPSQGAQEAGRSDRGRASAGRFASLVPWIALPYGIVVALLLARQPDMVGLLHDDGVYVSMAREIAAGHGPVDGHAPPTAPQTRFPPLHPLVLAAESALVGAGGPGLAGAHRLIAMNALWLSLALFLFLQWLVRRRGWPAAVALSAGLAAFTLPEFVGHAQHAMSEPLFTALLMLALLLIDGVGGGAGWRRLLLAGASCGLLPVARTAGSVFVAAALLVVLLRTRRLRATALFAAAAASPWILGAIWSALSIRSVPPVPDSPLFGPPYLSLVPKSLGGVLQVAGMNVLKLGDDLLITLLPGVPPGRGDAVGPFLLRVALLAGMALLAGVALRRRASALPWLLGAYALMLLPWPCADTRLIAPVAPLAVAWLGEGAAALTGTRGSGRGGAAVATAALLGLAGWNAPTTIDRVHGTPGAAPFFGSEIPLAGIEEAAAWLERSTAPDEVFAGTLDSTLFLLSGRRGVSSWFNDDQVSETYSGRVGGWRRLYNGEPDRTVLDRMFARAGDVVAEYDRLAVRNVVVLDVGGHRIHEALVGHLLHARTGLASRFERVFTSRDGLAEIWRLKPASP
jgi:hypothetical protein